MTPDERRELRDEMNASKTEMEIIFREITEIKDRIRDLKGNIGDLQDSQRWVGERVSSARKSGDLEEQHSYGELYRTNSKELTSLNDEIRQLQERKRILYEEHNKAKEKWSEIREILR